MFIVREEPENYGGLLLKIVEQHCCFHISQHPGGLCDDHAARSAVKVATIILLDLLADRPLVAAHVSGDLEKGVASITFDGLVDRSHDLRSPTGLRSSCSGLELDGKLRLVLTCLLLPQMSVNMVLSNQNQ